ncbi:Histidine phosphatase superfamily [Tylopilus felleus]
MDLQPRSTFLRCPLSLSNSDLGFEGLPICTGLNDLANLSPYHDAPAVPGVYVSLPDDCTVDQVILLHRHGSRGPGAGEQKYILGLVDTLHEARDKIQIASLPPYLEFLKAGYEDQLVLDALTIPGRKELFDHGVEFSLRYPTFSTNDVVSTTVPRVIDSAHFFAQGFFGREAENITFLTTNDFSDPVSWLTPSSACPKLSFGKSVQVAQEWAKKFVPPIVERLNNLIPGDGFSFNDTHGALYACPYDLAARDNSPWCNVFTTEELKGLEYEQDLILDNYSGYKSRGDPGPLAGAFYVKKLIERLTDTTKDTKRLYLDFAHDTTILLALSAMDLNKDAVPLSPLVDHPPADRKFRSSNQTPFAAAMIWEKFTCKNSFEGPQVRLVLNGATYPLSICEESEKDKQYGTCSLDAFVQANAYSMTVEYGNEIWKTTCGIPHQH